MVGVHTSVGLNREFTFTGIAATVIFHSVWEECVRFFQILKVVRDYRKVKKKSALFIMKIGFQVNNNAKNGPICAYLLLGIR